MPTFYGCESEEEKRKKEKEREMQEQTDSILSKALTNLVMKEYIDTDSMLSISSEYANLYMDSAELGQQYAMYWDSLSLFSREDLMRSLVKVDNTPPSYECADLLYSYEDEMTGKTTTVLSKAIIVSDDRKTGFSIDILHRSDLTTPSARIKVGGAGRCIDDDDDMNILFRDGTRLELENDGDFNCDAEFALYFNGSSGKKQLEMLKTKEIETMRIWTTKSYVQKDLTEVQSKLLLNSIKCFSEL